jgi:hypothetical protein
MMSRKTPLVCQHLENVSRQVLEEYQDIIRHYIRHRQGIYALFRRGKLYYVGLAKDLRWRLTTHMKDKHGGSWDRFSVYLTIGDTHMKELESLLLRIVKPRGNQQGGNFCKSENLKRRLKRDIKTRDAARLNGLFESAVEADSRGSKGRRPAKAGGRAPVLAEYVSRPIRLRAYYKGRLIKAHIRRDGVVVFGGKRFTSPSLAGAAAQRRRTCNGWTFWQCERAPGDWVLLDELRK